MLARELLRPDGVLIVAIDENEHAHLVALLEQLFPDHDLSSISVVHNPRGIQGDNFSFVHDYAIFVTPKGIDVIAKREVPPFERVASPLRNWGGESDREDAANCFYPVLVQGDIIVGFGDVPAADYHPVSSNVRRADGIIEIWPIDKNNVEKKWRYARQSIGNILSQLSVKTSASGLKQIDITKPTASLKTVWVDPRYDASTYGTQVVNKLTGATFPFPKSLFTVRDCIAAACTNRPEALILDFFGGSGTTLHATMMLNAELGGRRRCLLITNNEISSADDKRLRKQGVYRGDSAYEALGIAEAVTWPRTLSAMRGASIGSAGSDGRSKKSPFVIDPTIGFKERATFAETTLQEIDSLVYGDYQVSLTQTLLLLLGSTHQIVDVGPGYSYYEDIGVSVLFDITKSSELISKLSMLQGSVKALYIFSDIPDVLVEFNSRFPDMECYMLPSHYLNSMAEARKLLQ